MGGVSGINSSDSTVSILSDETNRVLQYANTGNCNPISFSCAQNQYNFGNSVVAPEGCNNFWMKRAKMQEVMMNPRELKKIEMMADAINESFKTFRPNNSEEIKEIFNKLSPEKTAILEKVYGAKYGAPDQLRKDLKSNLGAIGDDYSKSGLGSVKNAAPWVIALAGIAGAKKTGKWSLIATAAGAILGGLNLVNNKTEFTLGDAMKKLNDGAKCDPEAASIALKNSMEGLGTDEQTVNDIILSKDSSDEFLMQTMEYYEAMFGKSLQGDIKDDFSELLGNNQPYTSRLNEALTSNDPTYYSNYGSQRYYGIG